MNILFICKYNRFRSKIAELYFNKVNKTSSNSVKSAGLVPGIPVSADIMVAANEVGLEITDVPRCVNYQLLMWSDKIIIVADNIPPSLFEEERREGKEVIQWMIPDAFEGDKEGRMKILRSICKKVDNLVESLHDQI